VKENDHSERFDRKRVDPEREKSKITDPTRGLPATFGSGKKKGGKRNQGGKKIKIVSAWGLKNCIVFYGGGLGGTPGFPMGW